MWEVMNVSKYLPPVLVQRLRQVHAATLPLLPTSAQVVLRTISMQRAYYEQCCRARLPLYGPPDRHCRRRPLCVHDADNRALYGCGGVVHVPASRAASTDWLHSPSGLDAAVACMHACTAFHAFKGIMLTPPCTLTTSSKVHDFFEDAARLYPAAWAALPQAATEHSAWRYTPPIAVVSEPSLDTPIASGLDPQAAGPGSGDPRDAMVDLRNNAPEKSIFTALLEMTGLGSAEQVCGRAC